MSDFREAHVGCMIVRTDAKGSKSAPGALDAAECSLRTCPSDCDGGQERPAAISVLTPPASAQVFKSKMSPVHKFSPHQHAVAQPDRNLSTHIPREEREASPYQWPALDETGRGSHHHHHAREAGHLSSSEGLTHYLHGSQPDGQGITFRGESKQLPLAFCRPKDPQEYAQSHALLESSESSGPGGRKRKKDRERDGDPAHVSGMHVVSQLASSSRVNSCAEAADEEQASHLHLGLFQRSHASAGRTHQRPLSPPSQPYPGNQPAFVTAHADVERLGESGPDAESGSGEKMKLIMLRTLARPMQYRVTCDV